MSRLIKDKAVEWLRSHAGSVSRHDCATYVRQALEAGGLNMAGRPFAAKDYGPILQTLGFYKVSAQGYHPQKADIVVFQGFPGHTYGHIAIYTGTDWISDYRQPAMVPGLVYQKADPPMQVYRQ